MNLYLPYRLAQIIARNLPRPFAYWLGMRIADCFWLCDRRGRRAVRANLDHIMRHAGAPPASAGLTRMVRHNFEHFGKYLVDFFRLARMSPDEVHALVAMENMEYLAQALDRQKGVIIITAHLGNWELGGPVMTALGYQLSAVFHPESTGSVNRLFQQHRAGRGIHGIALGQAARSVIRVLNNRGMAAMLADRDFSPNHQTIEFFGAPARLPDGPARLARHTGAPLLPVFITRRPDDRFVLRIHPPVFPEACASVDDLRTRIRDVLELEIRRNPLQWFMFDEFWSNIKDTDNHE